MIFNEVIRKAGGSGQTYAEEPNAAGGNTAIITGGLSAYPLPTAGYNKVDFGNNTLIDLSSDTVTPADVASGKTFHDPNGVQQTGTLGYAIATGASLNISFDVNFEPTMFYVIRRGGWSGSGVLTPTTTHNILDIGMIDNHIYAQNYYRNSSYYIYINRHTESDISWTYSNNTLTISSASTTVGTFGTSSYELFYF